MKILLSPAKKLNETVFNQITTELQFVNETNKIQTILKNKSAKELSELMHISEKIGDLNWQRNQEFGNQNTAKYPAAFCFNGEAYVGLDIATLPEKQLNYLQQNLKILSGLYGMLRPLDAIYPYRLEMGTKLPIQESKNLYELWKTILTNHLKKELVENEVIVNLASKEYSKALDLKNIGNPVVECVFKDYKNGALKTIMVYAKKARGMMARFMAENQVETIEELKLFNVDGYVFDANISTEKQIVFTR